MKKIFDAQCGAHYNEATSVDGTTLTCGYCGRTVAPNIGFTIRPNGAYEVFVYECPCCHNPIIYNTISKQSYPGEPFGRDVKNLPENIQTLYDECRTCYANQCYTSSQMIARTLLMHIAVEQGADEDKSFKYYVDFLSDNNYIPPNGKQWVDFIRESGNVANHQILIKEKEETEKVITFLSSLLLFIYELPAEMNRGGTP